jgi:hypothetical protein
MESWGIQRLVFVDTDPLIFEEEMDPKPWGIRIKIKKLYTAPYRY